MIEPIRIQRSRQHKQISPNGLEIIYVGRPTKWGNPFIVYYNQAFKFWGVYIQRGIGLDPVYPKCKDKKHATNIAVKLFGELLMDLNSHLVEDLIYKRFRLMRDRIKDLQEKNLSCWCKVGEACHADVLLTLANADFSGDENMLHMAQEKINEIR